MIVVDEVGYIPFDPEAANLMFSLVSARYERASMIVTSNKPFSSWGEIFGDEVVAAAMIDHLVHASGLPRLRLPCARAVPNCKCRRGPGHADTNAQCRGYASSVDWSHGQLLWRA